MPTSSASCAFGQGGARRELPRTSPRCQNAMVTELAPKDGLPLDSPVNLIVDAHMTGTEGPRPSGKEQRLSYRTYGPLAVKEVACDRDTPHRRCSASSSVSLELSTEVKIGDLRRALIIDPPVPLHGSPSSDDETTSSLYLDGRLRPARRSASAYVARSPKATAANASSVTSTGRRWLAIGRRAWSSTIPGREPASGCKASTSKPPKLTIFRSARPTCARCKSLQGAHGR